MLVAIQILVNVHGAGSFAESSPTQQFWCDANTAARHTALNTIVRHKVYAGCLISLETRHRGWAADERENVANTSVLFGSPTTSECN